MQTCSSCCNRSFGVLEAMRAVGYAEVELQMAGRQAAAGPQGGCCQCRGRHHVQGVCGPAACSTRPRRDGRMRRRRDGTRLHEASWTQRATACSIASHSRRERGIGAAIRMDAQALTTVARGSILPSPRRVDLKLPRTACLSFKSHYAAVKLQLCLMPLRACCTCFASSCGDTPGTYLLQMSFAFWYALPLHRASLGLHHRACWQYLQVGLGFAGRLHGALWDRTTGLAGSCIWGFASFWWWSMEVAA